MDVPGFMPERRTLMCAGADMRGPDALGPDGWQRGLMPLGIRGPIVLHYASVVNLPEKCRNLPPNILDFPCGYTSLTARRA